MNYTIIFFTLRNTKFETRNKIMVQNKKNKNKLKHGLGLIFFICTNLLKNSCLII